MEVLLTVGYYVLYYLLLELLVYYPMDQQKVARYKDHRYILVEELYLLENPIAELMELAMKHLHYMEHLNKHLHHFEMFCLLEFKKSLCFSFILLFKALRKLPTSLTTARSTFIFFPIDDGSIST